MAVVVMNMYDRSNEALRNVVYVLKEPLLTKNTMQKQLSWVQNKFSGQTLGRTQ